MRKKIERYSCNEDIPQNLNLKLKDKVRFNNSRNWWIVMEFETVVGVALLTRRTRWGTQYGAILNEKFPETEDLFGKRWVRYVKFGHFFEGPVATKQLCLYNSQANVYQLDIKRG